MQDHYVALAEIAADYKSLRPVSGSVLAADWARIDEPKLKSRFESAYVFCFELCLTHIENLARMLGDQAYVVYSANEQYADRAGELATAYVRDKLFYPSILGCQPGFPRDVAGLQVADMAAFELYHLFHSRKAAKRPELDLLRRIGADDLSNGFFYNYDGLKILAAEGPMDFIIGQNQPPSSE